MQQTNSTTPKRTILTTIGLLLLIAAIQTPQKAQASGSEQAQYQVTISNLPPTVSDITCCFNDTGGTFGPSTCGTSYSISERTNYDIVCNFTVTDPNGYQDMTDGLVNVTWYRSSVAYNSPLNNDTKYVNASCKSIPSSANGNSMNYECLISDVKYWADAGTWKLLVNLTDGQAADNYSVTDFTIENVSSIWQEPAINFGIMALNQNGSAGDLGYTGKAVRTNNTGNTIIDVKVEAETPTMGCTIGNITLGNITYSDSRVSWEDHCGELTQDTEWQCPQLAIQDCGGDCSNPTTDKGTQMTYWGINVPPAGVGGTCQLQILFTSTQG